MKRHAALLIALLLCIPPAVAAGSGDIVVDAAASRIGFTLRTRWGRSLEGRFPDHSGEVRLLVDGRKQVHLRLSARTVEIVDHPRYSRLTRGEGFFDAEHHPEVTFVSEAFAPALVREGGELAGVLDIRGVQRRELFEIAPATCERPMIDCPVLVTGSVRRADYAMDRWAFALSERVQFHLSLRGTPLP
ncbi:YceI family protein [Luteimonas sp. RD2P54]|uniref:YceI family protein n=1 Tax=Luteimonas endophytica TaxID=3042023 RepID=A0ABT6JAS2_9GAMM|nr:YceI family protein [Luteimonas endophytica]MDH5823273.1 YceI family protein [Luteimonas endophytica]